MSIPTTLLLKDVISIYNALSVAKSHTVSVQSTYACIAMRTRLKPVIDAIEELNAEPAEITEYNKKKTMLCVECSLKDTAGDPVLYNKPGTQAGVMSYNIDPDRASDFQERMKALYKENEEILISWSNKVNEIQAMLNLPAVDLKPGMLSILNLSQFKPSMDTNALEALFSIIEDDSTAVK